MNFFQRCLFFLGMLFLGTASLHAQSPPPFQKLSPQAQVSLLTCGPGDALFEAFGHSAIRVQDPALGIDAVYNYGLFDFDQPNFYLNFIRGYMLYSLGRTEFERFLYQYEYFNRSVYEQSLTLSAAQRQRAYEFLEYNNLPKNRQYYYDYFFDNCATRPRDVFERVLGDSLKFDYSYANRLHYTIRDLIHRYIEDEPKFAWGNFGIDLGLGSRIDRAAKPREYMYQPEFLAAAFSGATVRQPDGSTRLLVGGTRTLFEATPEDEPEASWITPTVVLWIMFAIAVGRTAYDITHRRRKSYAVDIFIYFCVGFLGCLLLFLAWFTNHTAAGANYNLLWAWPTHALIPFLLFIRHRPLWVSSYFLASAIATGLTLLLWGIIPQDLNEALVPFLLGLTLRSAYIFIRARKLWVYERKEATVH
ncbi:protein of unknown function [Catalinimonas alkaloidigena]|uniref:Uncharacterized protein n=1 Tax=Catalinimonas alkaloidigena TaxID=1075417 RepID=A0A1G9BLZ0_9BACT|nr:DUF4105 domain-containing protein [Catalinimonas alkaloidigena]SDK40154.1 protein of unknown function [Catalinimonas alkaloidigena]